MIALGHINTFSLQVELDFEGHREAWHVRVHLGQNFNYLSLRISKTEKAARLEVALGKKDTCGPTIKDLKETQDG